MFSDKKYKDNAYFVYNWPGGIYTTAPAMGSKLIERLEKNNVMFFKEEL